MENCCNIGYEIGSKYIGPMIFSYIKYVLDSAVQKNVNKLYFMARDGWLMYNCALKLKENNEKYSSLDLEYFYISRLSVRLPQYYIMSIEEAVESLFAKEYKRSLAKVFSRIKITNQEINSIMQDIDLNQEYLNKSLNETEINICKNKLTNSNIFKEILQNKSKNAYQEMGLYLEYIGMISEKKIAIIDSGWIGSMQESLLMLLKSFGFNGKIIGYYFGMYKMRESTPESEYNTYYFSGTGDVLKKAYFNNNMFEILCSANHGMTIGYKKNEDGKIVPVLADYKYCVEKTEVQKGALSNIKIISCNEIYNNLKSLMYLPKKCYVDYLKNIYFSDSLSDNDMVSLAQKLSFRQGVKFLLPVFIFYKLTKQPEKQLRVFWEEGSIINSSLWFKKFFCLNVLVIKILRYIKEIN